MRSFDNFSNIAPKVFDAIHLASALLIQKEVPLAVNFICFDRHLNKAAVEEGLIIPF